MPRRYLGNENDLEITHIRGSGPGGQNRNKRMSGVRIEHKPTGIVVAATERRSQAQNLGMAVERLNQKLAALRHRPIPRVATKPSKSSERRRRDDKSAHSKVKKQRRKPSDGDW